MGEPGTAQSRTGDTSTGGTEPGARSWMQRDVFEVCSNGLPENTLSDIYEAINDVLGAAEVADWDLLSHPSEAPAMSTDEWAPKVRHTWLQRVLGGWIFQTEYGWWAHPESVATDYSWGPYMNSDVAERALRRGSSD